MFDVFDILVQDLSASAADLRPTPTVFGPADDQTYKGDTGLARDVYSDVASWTGSSARADWTVLVAADAANRAAESDQLWAVFLEGFVLVLGRQEEWWVTCESDCGQYPRERLRMSPAVLAHRLDFHRRNRHVPIAFVASAL